MTATGHHTYPVVAASFDGGATFRQVTALVPRQRDNWGDRDFIAVGPDDTVYVTWDYGPSKKAVKFTCSPGGSCAFAAGDLNVVLQKSTDRGRSFGSMSHISPGFPDGGAESAPLVVGRGGRLDVLYHGNGLTNRRKLTLGHAYSYFTSSRDRGRSWSAPLKVGAQAGTMATGDWWIDGDIAIDTGGTLYLPFRTFGVQYPPPPDGRVVSGCRRLRARRAARVAARVAA